MANADQKPTAPAAAVARHLEWLEYALKAARDEETRRKGRLDRATDKNRDKRTARLAEVRAEVRELDALVVGIKVLNARPVAATRKTPVRATKPKTSPAAKSRTSTRGRPKAALASASAATSSTRSSGSNGAKGPATPAPATPRRPRGRPRAAKPTPPSA
jgi:hypothetical protein